MDAPDLTRNHRLDTTPQRAPGIRRAKPNSQTETQALSPSFPPRGFPTGTLKPINLRRCAIYGTPTRLNSFYPSSLEKLRAPSAWITREIWQLQPKSHLLPANASRTGMLGATGAGRRRSAPLKPLPRQRAYARTTDSKPKITPSPHQTLLNPLVDTFPE